MDAMSGRGGLGWTGQTRGLADAADYVIVGGADWGRQGGLGRTKRTRADGADWGGLGRTERTCGQGGLGRTRRTGRRGA